LFTEPLRFSVFVTTCSSPPIGPFCLGFSSFFLYDSLFRFPLPSKTAPLFFIRAFREYFAPSHLQHFSQSFVLFSSPLFPHRDFPRPTPLYPLRPRRSRSPYTVDLFLLLFSIPFGCLYQFLVSTTAPVGFEFRAIPSGPGIPLKMVGLFSIRFLIAYFSSRRPPFPQFLRYITLSSRVFGPQPCTSPPYLSGSLSDFQYFPPLFSSSPATHSSPPNVRFTVAWRIVALHLFDADALGDFPIPATISPSFFFPAPIRTDLLRGTLDFLAWWIVIRCVLEGPTVDLAVFDAWARSWRPWSLIAGSKPDFRPGLRGFQYPPCFVRHIVSTTFRPSLRFALVVSADILWASG